MNLAALTAYELIKEENLTDIHAKGYLLRHKKSGAKISLISNDDEKDRKSTRQNSSHGVQSRMPSSA